RASYAAGLARAASAGERLARGVVAHKPWRAAAAEAALAAGATPAEAMQAELAEARDNGRTGFKIELARRLGAAVVEEARGQ
ncbi:MAG: xanthine dehydrogenase family protein subunit M, partial [Phenylobacterium sp.]